MKLSTRSRYGTRMMLDLAQRYDDGPVQIGDIAKRQDISVKYLEQLIIPLKKAKYVTSVRGPKGGHMLAKSPEKITVGEIVELLEGGTSLPFASQLGKSDDHADFGCEVRDHRLHPGRQDPAVGIGREDDLPGTVLNAQLQCVLLGREAFSYFIYGNDLDSVV